MSKPEIVWFNGKWSTGEHLIGPTDHSFRVGSSVFDGARAIRGHLPDLRPHCERVIRSAVSLGMAPKLDAQDIEQLVHQGLSLLPQGTDHYIKMLFFCPGGFLLPDADTTSFALHIFDAPLPEDLGFSATFSNFRRPAASMVPTEAKASCLYPNTQRVIRDANARGFNTAVVLDPDGNVAKSATANLWIVKDGVAFTPETNGTFFNGIARQRIFELLVQTDVAVQARAPAS
ncbi:branched-chain amino acid aminotransferase [Collimonas fungivorans]|uniref:branched-chain amino acid aminotransferase n=1 Tax=Collimonas fungivorans TaxID=158899 RepID=UPI000B00E1B1